MGGLKTRDKPVVVVLSGSVKPSMSFWSSKVIRRRSCWPRNGTAAAAFQNQQQAQMQQQQREQLLSPLQRTDTGGII